MKFLPSSVIQTAEQALKKIVVWLLARFVHSPYVANPAKEPIHRILVVRQHNQLGDMICATPLLEALRKHYPTSRITLIASPVNYGIMRNHPYVNEVVNYEKRFFFSSPITFWNFYQKLRKQHFDLAIVPATVSVSVTSDLIALLSGARIRIGAGSLQGQSNPSAFCFTHRVDLDWKNDPRRHQSLRNLDILAPLRIETANTPAIIGFTDDEIRSARQQCILLRGNHKLLIGFHPGAGKVVNRWHAQHFAAVANRVASEFDASIIITSGPMDDEPVRLVEQHLHCQYEVIRSQSIRRDAAMIDQFDLFVTNDTGIMHVAGATRTQVLALFGPTDPLQWAPIGEKNRFIVSEDGHVDSITEGSVFNMLQVILMDRLRHDKIDS